MKKSSINHQVYVSKIENEKWLLYKERMVDSNHMKKKKFLCNYGINIDESGSASNSNLTSNYNSSNLSAAPPVSKNSKTPVYVDKDFQQDTFIILQDQELGMSYILIS